MKLQKMRTHLRIPQREPSPDFAQSHLRNPEYNLARELLTKPVKEEEDAPARDADFDHFFAELLNALGLDPNGTLPAWWQGWPAKTHMRRWWDHLGLSEDRIIETATETRRDNPASPDGPKALDRAMEWAAQRDAQSAATSKPRTAKRQPSRSEGTRPRDDEKAAFYADMVNSDRFLTANTISNTTRDAMLSRGLVTQERLRARGVH